MQPVHPSAKLPGGEEGGKRTRTRVQRCRAGGVWGGARHRQQGVAGGDARRRRGSMWGRGGVRKCWGLGGGWRWAGVTEAKWSGLVLLILV